MSLRRQRGIAAALVRASLLGFLAIAALPAQAGAVERVADGNFEQTTCTSGAAGDCTSPAWTEAGSALGGTLLGPLCGTEPTSCYYSYLGYASASHWALVGSAYYPGGGDRPPPVDSSIQQNVLIPAAPATLRFVLYMHNSSFETDGRLIVSIDGQPVLTVNDEDTCCSAYHLFEIPVGGLAGPGAKLLRFQAGGSVDPGPCPACGNVESDFFQIDDVSLDAPDVPITPITPVTTQPVTGQRAAALAKCKKKRSKKARKRCRKRALQLPV
jgi:hypothetical protein